MTNRPPVQWARQFTPAAIEDIRMRYVDTKESMDSIGADYDVHRNTIGRLAMQHGWPLRRDRAAARPAGGAAARSRCGGCARSGAITELRTPRNWGRAAHQDAVVCARRAVELVRGVVKIV